MPRKKLIRQNQFPYHVTIRTNNKAWFQIPLSEVWNICKKSLIYAQRKTNVEINCFLLMTNHYHLLITTPDSNIDTFMRLFNSRIGRLIADSSLVINNKFNSPYKWTIIEGENYLKNVYRYIYQNPVRANMTDDCKSYPYSSLHFTSFEAALFNYKPHIIYGNEKSWFEKIYDNELESILKNALSKTNFKISRDVSTRAKHILSKCT